MTWKDIKLATLQKMFSAEGTTIPNDDNTADYLAAMPYAANEGIQMLSTAGKFIIKSIEISHNPQVNLLGDSTGQSIHSCVSGKKEFVAGNAHSYFFEMTGKGTATIKAGNKETIIDVDSAGKYTAYKGIIENSNNEDVFVIFNSKYPYAVKNIALYEALFETVEDVQEYSERIKYDLRNIAPDFYGIDEIYFEGDTTTSLYTKTENVYVEGDKVIAIDRKCAGNYTIYYKAFPDVITIQTEDDYELPLDREVAPLLPLYMASQLYKDDDISIATTYRNEFEVAFDRLMNTNNDTKAERVTSESGWI